MTLQFDQALRTGEKKLILPDHDKPLTPEDCDFLQSIYVPASPGNQSVVDLKGFDTDKIQGYVIIFKRIDGKKVESSFFDYSSVMNEQFL